MDDELSHHPVVLVFEDERQSSLPSRRAMRSIIGTVSNGDISKSGGGLLFIASALLVQLRQSMEGIISGKSVA